MKVRGESKATGERQARRACLEGGFPLLSLHSRLKGLLGPVPVIEKGKRQARIPHDGGGKGGA